MRQVLAGTVLAIVLAGCAAPATEQAVTPDPSAAQDDVASSAIPAPSASPTLAVSRSPSSAVAAPSGTALALLATLAVKGRAPKTGYDRDRFGQAWADVDRNGCDTRNDILERDLTGVVFKVGTRDCKVLSGALAEPYTGRTLTFTSQDGKAVQIDHVVALSDAWQKGAGGREPRKLLAFANDPINLLAVDGPTNASKSDGDAATWLPPNKGYRCAMVARQTAVKAKYGLWITGAERDAMARVLTTCPAAKVPTGGNPTLAPATNSKPPTSSPVGTEAPSAAPPAPPAQPARSGVDPDYGTCKNAKANGAGPYHQGKDPEYDYYRDGDRDGVVCE